MIAGRDGEPLKINASFIYDVESGDAQLVPRALSTRVHRRSVWHVTSCCGVEVVDCLAR